MTYKKIKELSRRIKILEKEFEVITFVTYFKNLEKDILINTLEEARDSGNGKTLLSEIQESTEYKKELEKYVNEKLTTYI